MDHVPAIVPAPLAAPRRWRLRAVRLTPLARREARQGYLFISPWIIGFLAFTALPMLATFAFSFLNLTLAQEEPVRFVAGDDRSGGQPSSRPASGRSADVAPSSP